MNGLILGGGHSRRMGQDKGKLEYHGKNQIQFNYDLLSKFCDSVFISVREDQKNEEHLKDLPLLFDTVEGSGPYVGILSAFERDSESPLLVLACDMPFVDEEVIDNLIKNRNDSKLATAYINPEMKWPEPLCTIWEPRSFSIIKENVELKRPSLKRILENSDIQELKSINDKALDNFNTPEDLESF